DRADAQRAVDDHERVGRLGRGVGVGRQEDAEPAALADAPVGVALGLRAAVTAEGRLGLGLRDRRDEAKVSVRARDHRPAERRRSSGASSASVPISVLAGVGVATGGRAWRASIMPITWRWASPGVSARIRAPVVRTPSSRARRRKSAIGSGPAAERTPYGQRATSSSGT